MVVEAQQLIDRAIAGVRILVRGEDVVPFDETVVDAVAIDPEASRVTDVVEGGDLGLHGTRMVSLVKLFW